MFKSEEEYNNLARPVCAFITFESDDGKNEALAFAEEGIFGDNR